MYLLKVKIKIASLCFVFFCLSGFVRPQLISVTKDDVTLTVTNTSDGLSLSLSHDSKEKLSALIGIGLPTNDITYCVGLENCIVLDDVRLHINSHISNGFEILWATTNLGTVLRDCYDLGSSNWYGGPERFYQAWPIEKINMSDYAYVTQEDNFTAIAEPYWLNSQGAYVYVDEKVPLFVDQNNYLDNHVCFIAKAENPYRERIKVLLNYTVAALENPKEAHLHAVDAFLGKPTGHPNIKMIERPIFSTWARYSRDVNENVVQNFSQEIYDHGYEDIQFELDDYWEECYGSLEFNTTRFPNITETVEKVKKLGFRFTLWVHPFVNTACVNYTNIGLSNDFFVRDINGSPLTQWWNSNSLDAQYLDFTNGEVREWFVDRLRLLQEKHGIDNFKFDAGETSWAPQVPAISGDVEEAPNQLTADYVRTCAMFGDLIEIRSGFRTQELPVFVRMIDKDSTWGVNNGLYTLVTTLLQMNLNGYTMVLPDMVGGNGYYGEPDGELFARWVQANTFMPSIQFSFVPWDFSNDTIEEIARKYVELHDNYTEIIVKAMEDSINKGYPVNAPIWWVDPTNPSALSCDDEYLLGEDVLVAPVLTAQAIKRDIVLPEGTWVDGNNGTVYVGNQILKDYPAPLEVLPYFLRQGSDAAAVAGSAHLKINVAVFLLLSLLYIFV